MLDLGIEAKVCAVNFIIASFITYNKLLLSKFENINLF